MFLLIEKHRTERKLKLHVLTPYQGVSTFPHRRAQEATGLKPSAQIFTLQKVARHGKFLLPKSVSMSTHESFLLLSSPFSVLFSSLSLFCSPLSLYFLLKEKKLSFVAKYIYYCWNSVWKYEKM